MISGKTVPLFFYGESGGESVAVVAEQVGKWLEAGYPFKAVTLSKHHQ